MEPITIAVIAAIQILLLTIVQAAIVGRKDRRDAQLRREEKVEDWRRQDEVAKRLAEAATDASESASLMLQAQKENTVQTEIVGKQIADKLTAIDEQGKKIHILVNSDMTAARTNERDQARLTLIALKRVQALSAKLGLPFSQEEQDAVERAEARIVELDQILADRLAAQQRVDEEGKKA